jgi:hypothetical protein
MFDFKSWYECFAFWLWYDYKFKSLLLVLKKNHFTKVPASCLHSKFFTFSLIYDRHPDIIGRLTFCFDSVKKFCFNNLENLRGIFTYGVFFHYGYLSLQPKVHWLQCTNHCQTCTVTVNVRNRKIHFLAFVVCHLNWNSCCHHGINNNFPLLKQRGKNI